MEHTDRISRIGTARSMYCKYSQYLEAPYCGYCLYSQVFRVSVLRVHVCQEFGTAHTLSIPSVVGPSQYSHCVGLLSTRNILAASTPILLVFGLRIFPKHLLYKISLKAIFTLMSAKKKIFRGNIFCMCWILFA